MLYTRSATAVFPNGEAVVSCGEVPSPTDGVRLSAARVCGRAQEAVARGSGDGGMRPSDQSSARVTRWPLASSSPRVRSPIRPSATTPAGTRPRGQKDSGKCVVWNFGASIESWRSSPKCTCARKKSKDHWSCWSPPGVPKASRGPASPTTMVGERVVRGRTPGRRVDASPGSSQVICALEFRQKPRPRTVGELCSQPPLGVAEIIMPPRSTMSRWQVSPRVVPSRDTVGSPAPAETGVLRGVPRSRANRGKDRWAWPSGAPGRRLAEAVSVIKRRRSSL